MNQRSQQKDESNTDWRFTQGRDYGSERRDSNGEPDPYERRWVVGTTISNDGTVINSPGLNQMVKDIEKLKVRPTLPQKSIKKFNSVAKMNAKALFDQQMEKIALVLGKDFKLKDEDLQKMKQEREHKQKVISRFADMSKPPQPKEPVQVEALLDEIKGILEGRKTSGILSDATKNIKLKKDKKKVLTVQDPFILPEDIEYVFENCYEEFLEDIKTKQNKLEAMKMKLKRQAQRRDEDEDLTRRALNNSKNIQKDENGEPIKGKFM